MKLYEALATAFLREDVDTCFALLGDANMHWAGALAELDVHFIYPRHEHAAVAGATAYARATGKVGVASVTCGPGLTQVMTILPIAVRARIPLIIFAGEAPLKKPWYNQAIDQAPFVQACGAEYRSLRDSTTMIANVHRAFADAKQLRQPIVLGVPLDIQQDAYSNDEEHATSAELYRQPKPLAPQANEIENAAALIAGSSRPVVLAGLGAVSAGAVSECIALAKHCGACLATTLPAKGLFHDQDFNLGVAGGYATEQAKALFAESDLIIAVGSRLAAHTFDGGKLAPNAKVIQINTDPAEKVQGREAAQQIVQADAKLGINELINASERREGWRTSEMRSTVANALELPDDSDTPDNALHPMAVVKKLADVIPPHCHIINTSGHIAYYTAQMNQHPQSHYTVMREFGAIGNGTSFALGIAAAHPERPVVLLDGDGSALMHIQELETMYRHKLNVLVVVLNDGAYGSEVHKLRADGVTLAGSVFGRPNFAAIAEGFGIHGETISDLDAIPDCIESFLSSNSAMVCDIHVSDQIASPQILKLHRASHSKSD